MHPTTAPRPVPLLLLGLATHRLTRLLIADEITAGLRVRVQEAAEARWARRRGTAVDPADPDYHSPLAFALSCPWCASVWVAAALVTGLRAAGTRLPNPALLALAASSITGLLASLEPEE